MDTGKHKTALESESLYDAIRKKWASRVTGVTTAAKHQLDTVSATSEDQPQTSTGIYGKVSGWALKTTKKPSRMTEKTKAYLNEIFQRGSQSGHKADPVQVSRQMKLERDGQGKLLFEPNEWRTPQQISQLFSRLAAAQKHVEVEDIAAEETEVSLAILRKEVMRQVGSLEHPVQIETRNICQLIHQNKLVTLKLAELQTICTHLDITPSGSLLRKKSFTIPIESYVKNCQCFQV